MKKFFILCFITCTINTTIYSADFLALNVMATKNSLITPEVQNESLTTVSTQAKIKKHQISDYTELAPTASDIILSDILGDSVNSPTTKQPSRTLSSHQLKLKSPKAITSEQSQNPTASDLFFSDILEEPTNTPRPPKQPYTFRPTPKHIAKKATTVNSKEEDIQKLFAALETHSATEFEKLLTSQPYRWQKQFNDQGYTLLMRAIQLEKPTIIEKLLYYGANSRLTTSANQTPLKIAIDTGNIQVVQALVSHTNFSKKELKDAVQYISQHYLLNRKMANIKYFDIAEYLSRQINKLPTIKH